MAARKSAFGMCASAMILAVVGTLLNGCATAPETQPGCESNFDTQGSFLTGKKFSTTAVVPNISYSKAYDNLYKIMVSDGYYIQTADQKAGVISAFQNVNLSDKKAPLNAIIQKRPDGIEISLVFIASAGVFTPESGARAEFCRIIGRVNN
ncbi:hypothetical protein N5F23_07020 [Pseudomonas sichuanensis]|uniref:hypothetical protein n=1 Tax=Pseudomonas sichuanensis TaxID=2213015 RepID=UPI00244B6C94|nr:hypothetical protein [Pseudomonas sichuanensis]MDH0730272.1 hypothetical protein [Pseudomonas sichuanensis]MDH1582342.1 hypothetical protein [Pseudomonas sichuanensis]MDH1591739.1 hypothetical protein [Pseudomonas sichuanensis]MDH1599536.1 hypothetical protein [Pseudomonas sichuanensis]